MFCNLINTENKIKGLTQKWWVIPLNAEINKLTEPKNLIDHISYREATRDLNGFAAVLSRWNCNLEELVLLMLWAFFFLKWYLERFNCCYCDKLCQGQKNTGFPERQTNKMYKIMKIKLHNPLLDNLYIWISPIHICTSFISSLTSDKYPTLTLQALYLFTLNCFTEICRKKLVIRVNYK